METVETVVVNSEMKDQHRTEGSFTADQPVDCFNSLENIGVFPPSERIKLNKSSTVSLSPPPPPTSCNQSVRIEDKTKHNIQRRPHQSLAQRAKDRIRRSLSRENLGILSNIRVENRKERRLKYIFIIRKMIKTCRYES